MGDPPTERSSASVRLFTTKARREERADRWNYANAYEIRVRLARLACENYAIRMRKRGKIGASPWTGRSISKQADTLQSRNAYDRRRLLLLMSCSWLDPPSNRYTD